MLKDLKYRIRNLIIDNEGIISLAGLGILLIFILGFIIPSASAVIIIEQMDVAYLGETVDLSTAAAWPDYQLAWCSDGEPGCSDPEIYDLGNVNQHKVYLDPNYWKLGNYYRWDGHWNEAENMDAFRILKGTRPAPSITIPPDTVNQTPTEPEELTYKSTSLILARGDVLTYNYTYKESNGGPAYIWLFRTGAAGMSDPSLMGELLHFNIDGMYYSWTINQSLSETLSTGKYSGYIEYSGPDKTGDIYYNPSHQIEAFKAAVPVLDTIYDDALIPDIDLTALTSPMIRQKYEQIRESPFLDDTFIPVSLTVYEPQIVLNDYYEKDGRQYLHGDTTISPGTTITVRIDPERHPLPQDARKHTWHTKAEGSATEMRTFDISLPIDYDELGIGNHTIILSAENYRYKTEVSKDFWVSDVYVIPTPTLERKKVITGDYGWRTVTTEPTPAATSTTVMVTMPTTYSENVSSTVATTATTATIPPTTAPTTKPSPTATRDPNIHVPLPWWIGIAGIFIAWRVIKR